MAQAPPAASPPQTVVALFIVTVGPWMVLGGGPRGPLRIPNDPYGGVIQTNSKHASKGLIGFVAEGRDMRYVGVIKIDGAPGQGVSFKRTASKHASRGL